MTKLEYYTAKIYALSGQPKFRGSGTKREYNTFYDFARIELLHFLEEVSDLRSKKKAVMIARTFRKMMNDEEEAKKAWVVCPISKKQAFVLAEIAINNGIRLSDYLEITNQENYEGDDPEDDY
jgi:hypothetical protein